MLNLEQKLWFTGWWFFVAIIFLHFPIYASLMFDWARSLLGSMPILRWYSQLCCHRRNTTQEPALDPARQTNQEALVPFEADSDAETETGSLPGRVAREVLWVLPTRAGSYFGHEGLNPPTNSNLEVRWYAVWDIPGVGRWRVAGLHWGHGNLAYAAILRLHHNEFRGIAFRRFDTKEEAAQGFIAEAANWDLTPQYSRRVFGWTFNHDLEARD